MRQTIGIIAAFAAYSGVASAQVTDSALIASRRVLIDRATAARASGDHTLARDLAQRAGQIQMTPSLRLFIAQEQSALGQLAEAYGSAIACVGEASRDNASNATTIVRICTELRDALAPRVGRVVVTVAPVVAGLRVTVARRELLSVLLGHDYVVTPGAIEVRAEATGFRAATSTVTVDAGASVRVTLALEPEPVAREAPRDVEPPAGRDPEPAPPSRESTPSTSQPTTHPSQSSITAARPTLSLQPSATTQDAQPRSFAGPIATLVTGGGLLLGATVATIIGARAASEYDALCTPECTFANVGAGRAAFDRGNAALGAGIVGFAVGGAAVIGGATWLLVSRSSGARRRVAFVQPTRDGAIVSYGGSF